VVCLEWPLMPEIERHSMILSDCSNTYRSILFLTAIGLFDWGQVEPYVKHAQRFGVGCGGAPLVARANDSKLTAANG